MALDRRRFEGVLSTDAVKRQHALILGCGTLGSFTAEGLARLGVSRFTLIDHDTVEAHNVTTQAFVRDDITAKKVVALGEHIHAINPEAEVELVPHRCEPEHIDRAVDEGLTLAFALTDNLWSRRLLAASLASKAAPGQVTLFDARMGLEEWTVHRVRLAGPGADRFLGTYFPEKTSDDPCNARSIPYTGMFLGAVLASRVKQQLVEPLEDGVFYGDVQTLQVVAAAL